MKYDINKKIILTLNIQDSIKYDYIFVHNYRKKNGIKMKLINCI